LCLTVANNGSKFSDEEKKHAFELFKNASNYGDIEDGIRLGLYTVKTAVNKLNGTVQIETNEQEMTEITVYIPNYYNTAETNNSFNKNHALIVN
jgi:K+-sensing histidine kinase KdpD